MSVQNTVGLKPSARRELVLSEDNLEDFARGAAFLGTGGGGDPYLGRLMAKNAIREFGSPRILGVDELSDDATVAFVAMIGAPTVLCEKGASGDDIDCAVQELSAQIGRPIDALMPGEIGGFNSTLPVVAAARLGLPLVDVDGMGRAFPSIAMVVMNFEGISACPFVLVDDHLNKVVVKADTAQRTEDISRSIAVQMGMSCLSAGYAMSGAEVKRATVHNTLSAALQIGEAIREGRKAGDPLKALIRVLETHPIYGFAQEVFSGKITDLRRETTKGFSVGNCRIEAFDGAGCMADVQFQNENLVVLVDGVVKAIVPDLIIIVDAETAEPIPTEALRYGQRVSVIAVAAPDALKTPQALAHVHPRCFGLDFEFTPIEVLAGAARA